MFGGEDRNARFLMQWALPLNLIGGGRVVLVVVISFKFPGGEGRLKEVE